MKEENYNLSGMTEEEIYKMAEKSIEKMSEQEIKEKGSSQKKQTYVSALLLFIALIGSLGVLIFTCLFSIELIMMPIIVMIVCFVFLCIVLTPSMFRWNYKNWAVYSIVKEIKQTQKTLIDAEKSLNEMQSIKGKKIEYTKILDSYTEYTDKLHGFLNYQEIIQHRMYKFLVIFEDGSRDVVTVEEGKKDYNKLMMYLKEEMMVKESTVSQLSVSEEIIKYKQLLDSGAITEEEYNKLKGKLFKE